MSVAHLGTEPSSSGSKYHYLLIRLPPTPNCNVNQVVSAAHRIVKEAEENDKLFFYGILVKISHRR